MMVEVEEKRGGESRVGKILFFLVVFALLMAIANRFYAGATEIVGAIAGFALFAAVLGGGLAIALNRFFLRKRLGQRRGLLASFLAMGALVMAYMLTLRPDGIVEHGLAMRLVGSALGLVLPYWWQHRRLDKIAD